MARWGRGVPALCRPARNPRIWHEFGGSSLSPLVPVGNGPCEEPLLGERGDRDEPP